MNEMPIESELASSLKSKGADIIRFVDISQLSTEQNRQFPNAILIGIVLSPEYLCKVTGSQEYVKEMIQNKLVDEDEFHLKERQTDELADYTANYLNKRGYSAYSQSENNIYLTGFYEEKTKSTPLPHKTIALLAGLGWIGKHNLLVNPEFGSAISMCTVLTDASLKTVLYIPSSSQCGSCSICVNICDVEAIRGNTWSPCTSRDEIVNVYKCTTCLKCLAFCPWTKAYMKSNL